MIFFFFFWGGVGGFRDLVVFGRLYFWMSVWDGLESRKCVCV